MDKRYKKKNCFACFTLAKKATLPIWDSQKNPAKQNKDPKILHHFYYKSGKVFKKYDKKEKKKKHQEWEQKRAQQDFDSIFAMEINAFNANNISKKDKTCYNWDKNGYFARNYPKPKKNVAEN